MEIDLYNVYLGPQRPPEAICHCKVGPFDVRLVSDYEEVVKGAFQPAYASVSWQWARLDPQPRGLDSALMAGTTVQRVTHVDEVRGSWVVSAKATTSERSSEQSFLARSPTDDGGIWDLCELLTFITGRRVLTRDLLERFNPNRAREPVCVLSAALLAASVAWGYRKALADRGLAYALLSHDSAFEQIFLQPKAAQYNTALNVIIDKWPLPKLRKVPLAVRDLLANTVEEVVAACGGLSEEQRKGYSALLRSRVIDGPYSMLDRLILLLRDLSIVEPGDGEAVLTRVRYLNTVRNRLTHSGEMPLLKDMTQDQSDRYTVNIVGGVLQELNQLALGRVMGFTAGGAGARSQGITNLRRFFTEGVWHNHPIELKDFQEWIEDPFSMG